MQDMLPGVLSTILILLGLTLMNSSSLPIECRMTMNSLVLHSSSGLSMSRRAGIDMPYSIDQNTPYVSVECQYTILSLQNTPYCLGNRYAI
ncbi:hypothetical protein Tco_0193872 [Tanacetum coccineum]